MSARAALGGLALLVALIAPAAAQAQLSAGDVEAARARWREGRDLAQQGDWQGARDAFAASLERVPRVSVLLSLATAEVRLGHGREALEALDALDALAHPTRDARHIEAARRLRPRAERLAEEQAQAEAEAAAAEPEPEPEPIVEPPPEPEPEPEPTDDSTIHLVGGAVTAGAGALTLIAAAVTFGLRQDALSRRDGLCPDQVCPSEADRDAAIAAHGDAGAFNDAANGLGIAGAILVAGGAAWLIVGLATGGQHDDDVALAPWVSGDGAGVVAAGRY